MDIDFRQYGDVYSGTGQEIFEALQQDVLIATSWVSRLPIAGSRAVVEAEAQERVTRFFQQQRAALSQLDNNSQIESIFGARGIEQPSNNDAFERFWFDNLLRTGRTTFRARLEPTPTVVEAPGPLPSLSKYTRARGHSDHFHVRLFANRR